MPMNHKRANPSKTTLVDQNNLTPWDSEENHLLSYFLDGDGDASGSHIPSILTDGHDDLPQNDNNRTHLPNHNVLGAPSNDSYSAKGATQERHERSMYPTTPAMNFYGHGHTRPSSSVSNPAVHQPRTQPPTTSASISTIPTSSTSISSMAAALVSDGPLVNPLLVSKQQQHNRGKETVSPPIVFPSHGPSPISPAAMIGAGQENLMLPPPPRHSANSGHHNEASSLWFQQFGSAPMMQQQNNCTSQYFHGNQHPQQKHNAMGMSVHQQHAHHYVPGTNGLQPGKPSAVVSSVVEQQKQQTTTAASVFVSNQVSSPHGRNQENHQSAESEERRARRLARNRESARQSRRRKKENLARLGNQVNKLYTEIEIERRNRLNSMEGELQQLRRKEICLLEPTSDVTDGSGKMDDWSYSKESIDYYLALIMQITSPRCAIRQQAARFQSNSLKSFLLPKYQEFMLWLTLHPESFFTDGKEKHAASSRQKITSGAKKGGELTVTFTKATPARVSSKQVGEDIFKEWKANSNKMQVKEDSKTSQTEPDGTDSRNQLVSGVFDSAKVWPLFCYELSISVDQEERMLQAHKRLTQETNSVSDKRCQIEIASRMVSNITNGLLYQSHLVSHRGECTLLNDLSSKQTIKYLQWFEGSKEKSRNIVYNKLIRVAPCTANTECDNNVSNRQDNLSSTGGTSLQEICQELEEILRIPSL